MGTSTEHKGITTEIRQRVETALTELNISFPPTPDPALVAPRRWFMRGESQFSRLLTQRLEPHPGEWATYGVFMGDCFSALMYPTDGIFYIFDKENFADVQWLNSTSQEFQNLLEEEASKRALNLSYIKDDAEAENQLYRKYYIYQPHKGIITFPTEVAVEAASYILIPGRLHPLLTTSTLNETIKNKLISI